jgi:hypothetical protein
MGAPTGTLLRFLLPGLVLALVLVSGCSDDPVEGAKVPPRATPTSTSASPTPATPEEQIKATMEAYFAETNAAFESGDVARLRTFSTKGCPCRDAARTIEATIKSGGRFENLRYEVVSIRVHDVEAESGLAEVVAKLPPYKVYDADGSVTEDSGGGKLHTDFSLVKTGDRWVIGNSLNLE